MPNFTALARRWIADARYDVVLFPYEELDDVTEGASRSVGLIRSISLKTRALTRSVTRSTRFAASIDAKPSLPPAATTRTLAFSSTKTSPCISDWRSLDYPSPPKQKSQSSIAAARARCRPRTVGVALRRNSRSSAELPNVQGRRSIEQISRGNCGGLPGFQPPISTGRLLMPLLRWRCNSRGRLGLRRLRCSRRCAAYRRGLPCACGRH